MNSEIYSPEMVEKLQQLIATNEAYRDVLATVTAQFEQTLSECDIKLRLLAEQKTNAVLRETKAKKPVSLYMPPYFKDENGMYPPLNEEAKRKMQLGYYNPLMKEEKRWTPSELKLLRESIKKCLINVQIEPLLAARDILTSKLKSIDTNTKREDKTKWKYELEDVCRKIDYYRNQSDDKVLTAQTDYSNVEWTAISNIDFKKTRTPQALRAKWINEQSPKWNKAPWTKEELMRMKEKREKPSFVSWNLLALDLGTNRTPYQCFQKYKREVTAQSSEWTQDEDKKLIALVKMFTNNGIVQWDKVAQFMPGRSRQQLRTRFTHTLDTTVKHGRWTDHEDLLLICSVNKHGAKDWGLIADAVPGRCDSQCRERWCNILSKKMTKEDWDRFTIEEDELLVLAVKSYGRGNWSKCKALLPKKDPRTIRRRYVQLVNAKLKMVSSMCSAVEAMNIGRRHEINTLHANAAENARLVKIFNKFTEVNECADNDYTSLVNRINSQYGDGEKRKYDKLKGEVDWSTVESIKKKHKESSGEVTEELAKDVLDSVEVTEEDIGYLVQRFEARKRDRENTRMRKRQLANVDSFTNKRIRPTTYEDSSLEMANVFEDDVPEEERRMTLVENLCILVRNKDYDVWIKQNRDVHAQHSQELANVYVKKIFENNQAADPNSLAFRLTMAPTSATCTFYQMMTKLRPSLSTIASQHFRPVTIENNQKFTARDRLNLDESTRLDIRLSKEVTGSESYRTFAGIMRAILLEPAILEVATEKMEKTLMKQKLSEMIAKKRSEETATTSSPTPTCPEIESMVNDGLDAEFARTIDFEDAKKKRYEVTKKALLAKDLDDTINNVANNLKK